MREFTTALSAPRDVDEDVITSPATFVIDRREITFRGATSAEVFTLMAAVSDTSTLAESVSTAINVLYELMEDDDRRWLRRRLFDRTDPMGPENIAEYVQALVEEWSARPTEDVSDSSASPERGGQPSKVKQRSGAKTS
jgi:hypothetical protein